MTAAPGHLPVSWDGLLSTWQVLDVPEGWRAEIVAGGVITLTPPAWYAHNRVADIVHWAIREISPPDVGVYQTLGVQFPLQGRLYIPDLCVCPVDPAFEGRVVPADRLLLAAEITSAGNAADDRTKKRWAYAHAPVPLYLLIDRFDPDGPTVTLFSEPDAGVYRRHVSVPFGESVTLPAPFGIDLPTVDFPTG